MTSLHPIAKLVLNGHRVAIAVPPLNDNAMHIDSESCARLLAGIPVPADLLKRSARLRQRLKRLFGIGRSHAADQAPDKSGTAPAPVEMDGRASPRAARSARPVAGAEALAPMSVERVRDARQSLRRILDCHPAAPAIWPSIALVDRAMRGRGGAGIERLSPLVLQDAARVLNRLMDELCEQGIVVLLERIDRVLRVVHGCAGIADMRWQAVRPAEIQVLESTITEFMEINQGWDDRLLAEQGLVRRDAAEAAG
jgi:hypothetical protein